MVKKLGGFLATLICTMSYGMGEEASSFPIVRYTLNGSLDALSPSQQKVLHQALEEYTGDHKSMHDVILARSSLQDQLDKMIGQGKYTVHIPEQKINRGEISLHLNQVSLRRLSKVTITPPKGFHTDNVMRSLPSLKIGEELDVTSLQRDIAFADVNPLKNHKLSLAQEGSDQVSVEVQGEGEGVWLSTVKIDNYGPSYAKNRLGLGMIHGNISGRDDVVSLNAIVSDHPSRMRALAGSYTLPFYGMYQSIQVYGNTSNSKVGKVAIFDIRGEGTTLGTTWRYYMPSEAGSQWVVKAGYEWREYINDTYLFNLNLGNKSRTAPLMIGLEANKRFDQGSFMYGSINLEQNIAGRLGSSSQRDLRRARADATGNFTVFKFQGGLISPLPKDWRISANLSGQISPSVLVSGEQQSIGGPYYVRGFREDSAAGDSAAIVNVELSTPGLKLGHDEHSMLSSSLLRGFVFADYGRSRRNKALLGEDRYQALGSLGAGLGIDVGRYLDANVYYAKQMNRDKKGSIWANLAWRF